MVLSLSGSNCGSLRVEQRDEMPPTQEVLAPAAAGAAGDDEVNRPGRPFVVVE